MERKITDVCRTYKVSIPREVAKHLAVGKGDSLKYEIKENGEVVIKGIQHEKN